MIDLILFIVGGSPDYRERHENGFASVARTQLQREPGARYGTDERFVDDSGAGRYVGGDASSRPGGPPRGFNPPGGGGGGGGPPGIGRSGRLVGAGGEGPQEGAVLMVYGLNMDKMNADRVFNLLCLYGNVFKVSPSLFCLTLSGGVLNVYIPLTGQIPQDERRFSHGTDG